VLAYLMLYFYRAQTREFLRYWAYSLISLAVYLITSAGSLGLFVIGDAQPYSRLVLSQMSLVAAYLHVAWFLIGTYEAAFERTVETRRRYAWLGLAIAFGLITASLVPFDPEQRVLRSLLRFELRYVLTGLAFLIAAAVLWRVQVVQKLIGIRIGAIGFCLYGLQLFHVAIVSYWHTMTGTAVFYMPYIGLLELLTTSLVSLGIVIWLLETQRLRTSMAQSELAFARTHDPITRLPNRRLLTKQLEAMLTKGNVKQIAVVSIHVNRFALVHRTFGWRQAEQLMARISNRIRSNLHSRCVIGRIAERDFMVLRPTLDDPSNVREWCEGFLKTLSRPIAMQDREFFVGLNAGISLYPLDSDNAEALMQESQRALTQSTLFGRGVVMHHHIDRMRPLADESSLQIEGDLRRAIEQKQFVMYFQPIVCSNTGQVHRFEALLRWRHPERGVLGPDEFMEEALVIGLLNELEDQAMDMALGQLKRWHKALSRRGAFGGAENETHQPGLSLNLSAQRFQQPDIVFKVEQACKKHGIHPRHLELEITE
ncbi:MAG: EAL domain-containing protein, partial [Pseudomonadota bacterium]